MCRPLTPWFMRENRRVEPHKCHDCGEELEYEQFELYGNYYCEKCAVEAVKNDPELYLDAISDFLHDRKSTPQLYRDPIGYEE